jgi:pullulanase/glycogen debranching enzyme
VPNELRGKYGAFAQSESAGCRHLAGLARAGLTHVHLLPTYDFGSVNERESEWKYPEVRDMCTTII